MDMLCREFELPSLLTEKKGVYVFPLESGNKIAITDLPPGYSFSCVLGECPVQNKEEFLSHVMFANLFGKGTNGAVLGLDENGNLLTLSQTVDYTTNYKAFKEKLEDFASTADFWSEELKNSPKK